MSVLPGAILRRVVCALCLVVAAVVAPESALAQASSSVHLGFHWHLHQPIYWPETAPGTNRYQAAKDSIDLKFANSGNFYAGSTYKHPRNALVSGDGGEFDSVFDKDDRRAAYQSRGRDSIGTMSAWQDAGASVSYSGALMENIGSLGRANSQGYGTGWKSGYTTARGWQTRGGFPKADMVGMTHHHAFSPLLPRSVLRKEIRIFKELWWKTWNGAPDKSDHSKGFWPIECAFSRHIIPVLLDEGYEWVIVPNSHLARTCANYLAVAQRGNSGWNIDPPNRADALGPNVPANQWWSGTLDGRGGAFPAPFAYQAHKAQWVDPATGVARTITIVPMCDLLSYQNGFGTMGTGAIDAEIAPFNNPAQPSIVLMAHDGDNAWGGGYSYYLESVPALASAAQSKGYKMTTIQQFLADHPVPAGDVVHIEDGAWFNAANDWGHPQFINWLWPPARRSGTSGYDANDPRTWFDIENGWTEDFRNWAVLVAGANWCETAEQITITGGGSVQPWKIQEPSQISGASNNPNAAEQAWHYYLGGLDSGFMYYGTSLDDEVKQTLACNKAIGFAQTAIGGNLAQDTTPPTVFKPQRFPWNPGGKGWGPLTGYRPVGMDGKPPYSSDFYIWTFVHDVSNVAAVTLHVRVDGDGVNPLVDHANETFAGGAGVGAWQAIPMTRRTMPTGNVNNDPNISFFLTPTAIADEWWAKVNGFRNVLLDYYIEAADARGNVTKSDIQHVFVEDDGTSTLPPGVPTNLAASAVSSSSIALSWTAAANATSYRVNRGGTQIGTSATNSFTDTGLAPSTTYTYTVAAENSAGVSAASAPASATTHAPPPPPAAPTNLTATAASSSRIDVAWAASAGATSYAVRRGGVEIGTTATLAFSDTGLAPATSYSYDVIARNAGGNSAPSAPATATTLVAPVDFAMDGTRDSSSYKLIQPGMNIYACVRGTKLYVATWTPSGGVNDHFIFVSDSLLAAPQNAAPWSKAGLTAFPSGKPFLAAESTNQYIAWSNAPGGSQTARSATAGGVMEGVIDLAQTFGSVPATLYFASAAYQTANGGALASQAPAGAGDASIDPAEFHAVPLAAIRDSIAAGAFDFADPNRAFRLTIAPVGEDVLLEWPSIPGWRYRVQAADDLAAPWQDLAPAQTAPSGAAAMIFPDSPTTAPRFYHVIGNPP